MSRSKVEKMLRKYGRSLANNQFLWSMFVQYVKQLSVTDQIAILSMGKTIDNNLYNKLRRELGISDTRVQDVKERGKTNTRVVQLVSALVGLAYALLFGGIIFALKWRLEYE